ncbi:hypothetical protein [Kitasatospora sp. NPDC015120]|uniref:hypothetical protein n=1 Tax=Kitasatospora sp. NPDC015120 TaxID=3364023 RepID=UPI0036F482E6
MFDPEGADPPHLPDQYDAVEGFAEFVGEIAEFVTDLVEGATGITDLFDEQADEQAGEQASAEDGPEAGEPAETADPAAAGAVFADPVTAVDPTDFIRDILTADADQLASMEDRLRGLAGKGDFGPTLPPDLPADLPPDLPPDLRGPA